ELRIAKVAIGGIRCGVCRQSGEERGIVLSVIWRVVETGYLKGQPNIGLWYSKDSPFDLVAYNDSDHAGASLDRKSITGGCQFLGCRLISWQCKKQTVVENSIIEAEYAKTVNREVQLQALVDGKKVIITESTIRRDLQLEDAEGIDCLPNATIFEQLTLMGMVKNLDNAGKFLMYPRFMQVFLNKQVDGMLTHKKIYEAPSHTKNIFRNKKRLGKGFSGRETPLFPTMMVQAQEEMGEGSAMQTAPHHTHTINQPSTSQPQKKQKSRRPRRKDTEVPQPSSPITNVVDEVVNEEMDDSLERAPTTATSLDTEQDRGGCPRRQDTMGDTSARTRVLDLENTKTSQAQEITSLKLKVKKLEKKGGSRTHKLKRLYKVGRSRRVESSDEASLGDQEDASKQGRIDDIDANEDIYLVNVHRDEDMFGVNDLEGDEVVVESEVAVKDVNLSVDEVT
ncbi:hypothetical protein Tco_1342708, partial [Tanacetum coccineum]